MLHFYPAKEIVHSGQSPQSRDWRLGSELGTQSNCQLQPWHSGSRSESLAGGAACLSVRRCGLPGSAACLAVTVLPRWSAGVARAPTAKFRVRVTGIADKLRRSWLFRRTAASCRRLNDAQAGPPGEGAPGLRPFTVTPDSEVRTMPQTGDGAAVTFCGRAARRATKT